MEIQHLRDYLLTAIDELLENYSEEEVLRKLRMSVGEYAILRKDFDRAETYNHNMDVYENYYLKQLSEYEKICYPREFYSEKKLKEVINEVAEKLYNYKLAEWNEMGEKERKARFISSMCDFCRNKNTNCCNVCPKDINKPFLKNVNGFLELEYIRCPKYDLYF